MPNPTTPHSNSRKYLFLATKSTLSIGLLAFLLSKYSVEDSLVRLGNDWGKTLTTSVLILLSGLFLGAYRWWELIKMSGPNLAFQDCLRLTMIGHFFNQFLPSSVGGDVVRTWSAYKLGLTLGHATTSALLDRISGLIGLLILIVIGIPYLLTRTGNPYALATVGAIAIAGVLGLTALMVLDKLTFLTQRWKIAVKLGVFSQQMRSVITNPKKFLILLTVSIITHFLVLFLGQFLAGAMGATISFKDVILIFPAVILVSSLPFSIAGWGVREAGIAAGFSILGLPIDVGVSVSILIGLSNVLAGLPGAALWSFSFIPRRHG